MAPFLQLFLALQTKLKSILDTDGNPIFRHIDQELGQLEQERPAVTYPCVLIDISEFDFELLGQNSQCGTGKITLRVAFAPYSNTANAPDTFKNKALNFYQIEQALYMVLQGWMDADLQDIFGTLNRTSARTEPRADLRIRHLTFALAIQDNSASNTPTTAPAPIPLFPGT